MLHSAPADRCEQLTYDIFSEQEHSRPSSDLDPVEEGLLSGWSVVQSCLLIQHNDMFDAGLWPAPLGILAVVERAKILPSITLWWLSGAA